MDCKGTLVTIEKILLDKTGTFMIAAVEGDIRGRTDSLCVDLFDGEGQELGRSIFLQKLPGDKTLQDKTVMYHIYTVMIVCTSS